MRLCTLLKLQGSQATPSLPFVKVTALYSVEITRFSSRQALIRQLKRLCTLLKLQGSQARSDLLHAHELLCTLLKLQGSQAAYKHLS